jgi:DNA-binding NarL/FixJ family response regulator
LIGCCTIVDPWAFIGRDGNSLLTILHNLPRSVTELPQLSRVYQRKPFLGCIEREGFLARNKLWEMRMAAKKGDWISLIKAGYCLESDDRKWVDKILFYAGRLVDAVTVSDAWLYTVTARSFSLGVGSSTPALSGLRRGVHQNLPKATIDALYRTYWVVATGSDLIQWLTEDQAQSLRKWIGEFGNGVFNIRGINCRSGTGSGLIVVIALAKDRPLSAKEHKRWSQVAVHLGAGLRLRKMAQRCSLDIRSMAVLGPSGTLRHSRAEATTTARANLREAVLKIERCLTRVGRQDPDVALENWRGLVNGRWSLIDYFDTDGKRFVVAIKNDPAHPDPRGLTQGERQIAEYIGMGYTTKEIAYALGISVAAVTNAAGRVQMKLGLSSRLEAASFFSVRGLRRELIEVVIDDNKFLIGTHPLVDLGAISCLTEAERAVAVDVVSGSTNSDIARRRGVSDHTVINQVQSIFEKLRVHSRGQLAARLQAREKDHLA